MSPQFSFCFALSSARKLISSGDQGSCPNKVSTSSGRFMYGLHASSRRWHRAPALKKVLLFSLICLSDRLGLIQYQSLNTRLSWPKGFTIAILMWSIKNSGERTNTIIRFIFNSLFCVFWNRACNHNYTKAHKIVETSCRVERLTHLSIYKIPPKKLPHWHANFFRACIDCLTFVFYLYMAVVATHCIVVFCFFLVYDRWQPSLYAILPSTVL